MMNYDMQQTLGVPPTSTNNNNNNPNRVSPHLYYQPQQLHHQQQQQQQHRLKNEPFSPPISLATNNTRSSLNDRKTPIPQQQRPVDYVNTSPCPEPSLKHARFDPPVWPNTT